MKGPTGLAEPCGNRSGTRRFPTPASNWNGCCELVFSHPACPAQILSAEFPKAKADYARNYSVLNALVANPNTPLEFVEEIADSGDEYPGVREVAKAALSRRLPDTDHDGLPDAWEIREGLNPEVADAGRDSDGDGLTNAREYRRGTHPTQADSDGDGLPDGFEVDNRFGPLSPLHESDALPAPSAFRLEKRQADGRWLLRWSIELPEQMAIGVDYIIYRDGAVIPRPSAYSRSTGYELPVPASGELVFQVQAKSRGEFSRLSARFKIQADPARHEWVVVARQPADRGDK